MEFNWALGSWDFVIFLLDGAEGGGDDILYNLAPYALDNTHDEKFLSSEVKIAGICINLKKH